MGNIKRPHYRSLPGCFWDETMGFFQATQSLSHCPNSTKAAMLQWRSLHSGCCTTEVPLGNFTRSLEYGTVISSWKIKKVHSANYIFNPCLWKHNSADYHTLRSFFKKNSHKIWQACRALQSFKKLTWFQTLQELFNKKDVNFVSKLGWEGTKAAWNANLLGLHN